MTRLGPSSGQKTLSHRELFQLSSLSLSVIAMPKSDGKVVCTSELLSGTAALDNGRWYSV